MGTVADLALLALGRIARVAPVVDVPQGRRIELPGRGHTFLIDTGPVAAPKGRQAPTLMLLHALACTSLLTWYPSISVLSQRYRLVMFDQRWHGQGIYSDRFSLEDCADDTVAVADQLGLDQFVPVGYSMGSLVAQLAWRRHADRIAGAVLCAATSRFATSSRGPVPLRILGDQATRAAARRAIFARPTLAWQPGVDDNKWALGQFRSTAAPRMTAAAAEIGRFDSSRWINAMDVPTAVVVTTRDRLIAPARQRWLARQIAGATVYEVDGGHASCVMRADKFTPALQAACASVSARAAARAQH